MLFTGIKNEFRKLVNMKWFVLLSVFISMIPKSLAYLFMLTNKIIGLRIGNAVFSSHDIMMRFFVPFMAIALCLRLFTREQKNNYILGYIVKPVGKGTLFMSKIGAVCVYLFIMVTINYIFSTFITMIGEGIVAGDIYKSILALVISAFPILIMALLASLASQISKSRILNLVFFYMIIIVMALMGSYDASLYPATINSTMSFFKIFMGNQPEAESTLLNMVMVLGYTALLLGISGYIFENKKYRIKK